MLQGIISIGDIIGLSIVSALMVLAAYLVVQVFRINEYFVGVVGAVGFVLGVLWIGLRVWSIVTTR